MKIFIIGNIGAGKSILAKLLHKNTGYTVFSIDKMRIKNNPLATFQGEKMSWDLFKKTVIAADNCIVESTGCSKYYESLLTFCPDAFIIKVQSTPELCKKNIEKRKAIKLLPYDFDLGHSIYRNHVILQSKICHLEYDGNFDKIWQKISVLI